MTGKDDLFARPPKSEISPFELNNEGPRGKGQALVLRYADCNLRCPLCYAWKYAWLPTNGFRYDVEKSVQALTNLPTEIEDKRKIVWVRIQGGEPCLNYNRILFTVRFVAQSLKTIHDHGLNYYPNTRAVIQTNGIKFSSLDKQQIAAIREQLENQVSSLDRGKIVFEFSFKSSNDQATLAAQLLGFRTLSNELLLPLLEKGLDNLPIYPVAGLGPSIDFHNTWLVPIETNPLPKEIPLFHPSTWSTAFREALETFQRDIIPSYDVYQDFRNNSSTNGGRKTAIEEFEPTGFQSSWISGYAKNYEQLGVTPPILEGLLRKTTESRNRQWYGFFGRYSHWVQVLDSIPLAHNPTNLLELVREMGDVFYSSHPTGHYPYL